MEVKDAVALEYLKNPMKKLLNPNKKDPISVEVKDAVALEYLDNPMKNYWTPIKKNLS